MFRRLSVRTVQGIAKAAVVMALALIGGGTAHAQGTQTWKITLQSSAKGATFDVYDVVARKYVAKGKNIGSGATFDVQATKGGGWDVDKVGANLRWSATQNGRCWWGQVCSTKPQVSSSVQLRPDDSVAAGNCSISGSTPACGSSN